MLGMAIGLQVIAFAAMFGFGGVSLGLAVLTLTLLLLVLSMTIERRQTRLARSRRLWTYYVINDRWGDSADAKRLVWLGQPPKSIDRTHFLGFDRGLNGPRFRDSLGSN